jgi:hypothetical protein
MRLTLTFLVLLHSLIPLAQNAKYDSLETKIILLENRVRNLEHQISQSNQQISFLKEQSNSQTGMLDTAFDGVSTQLSASSIFVAIFSILIGLFSLGLGIYVARIERHIRGIAQDNETLLQRNVQIRQDVDTLSKKITSDPKGLYSLLKKEESDHIIDRLLVVPDDIVNLYMLLVSRDLEPSHFSKVKEALMRAEDEFQRGYDALLFQHFTTLSMFDDEIRPRIVNSLDGLIARSFKNDIIKSTRDYFNFVYSRGIRHTKEEVNKFAVALSKSKYKNSNEIYFSISNQMPSREEKFLLYDIIEKSDITKEFRIGYGNILLDYKASTPSPFETGIINEIETLKQ